MLRILSPHQSWSKAVVCVSTPRMYPRSGYFLVLYNNEFFALTCLFLLSFINLFVRSSPDQMFGTTGMSTGRGVLTTSTHTSHTGTCNNFPTSRWWWDMAALALLSSYFIAIWRVFFATARNMFYYCGYIPFENRQSPVYVVKLYFSRHPDDNISVATA